MGWVVTATPRPLYRERPGTHCTGGWVCPGPAWTGAENLVSHRNSIPGPSSPQRVAIPPPGEDEWYNSLFPRETKSAPTGETTRGGQGAEIGMWRGKTQVVAGRLQDLHSGELHKAVFHGTLSGWSDHKIRDRQGT
jgi:hypothetical protein